jgi:prevent-host-death family protein
MYKLNGGQSVAVVSASEAKQGLASIIDVAAREPVVIQRHERDVAVLISMDEYRRLSGLAVAEFRRVADEVAARARDRGLTPDKLEELLSGDV